MNSSYHGWSNYETWNVALWIQNDEYTYNASKTFTQYNHLVTWLKVFWGHLTPDGVRWDDPAINEKELDALLSEL